MKTIKFGCQSENKHRCEGTKKVPHVRVHFLHPTKDLHPQIQGCKAEAQTRLLSDSIFQSVLCTYRTPIHLNIGGTINWE